MAIGEIFLAAFLGVLFTRLTSPELLKFARREGIWKKADKWREMILKVQEVLDDAEEKQLTEKAVKIWMDDLRDLAYDVEDLLDEFATESLRRALMAAEEDNRSKIRRIMSTTLSFTKISARAIRFNPKMRSKMKVPSSSSKYPRELATPPISVAGMVSESLKYSIPLNVYELSYHYHFLWFMHAT
ncbi:hypothetical protein NC652_011910 [Populus alba x Populus x berolinensis]|nr:hypothetical protein NC652_011910 [Populus alba x Populus x berolinensis]